MSPERKELRSQIHIREQQIGKLQAEINLLQQQDLLMSDDEQWFTEEDEVVERKINRKTVKKTLKLGWVKWNQNFRDEGTGNIFPVERKRLVKINGQWGNHIPDELFK